MSKTKTTLADLNEYLFAQLDALSNDELSAEDLDREIERSKAMIGIANTVINGANVALQAQKHMDEFHGDKKINIPLLGMTE